MTDIPQNARNSLEKLVEKYNDIFALGEDSLTTNNFYTQNIELTDNVPVYIPNYRSIHAQSEEIENQIKNLLDNDIIEHSVSSHQFYWCQKSRALLDKKWRMVVDYRQLNKKVLADRFPLPRIDTILDQLGRAKCFSTLDLMAGFHPSGHYAFTRLPFGLNISPNSFQRMMTIAMAGLTPECAFV